MFTKGMVGAMCRPSSPAKAGDPVNGSGCVRPRTCNRGIKIVPIRVGLLDQSNFPGAIPLLQPLLALDCIFSIEELFIVNESMHAVLVGKAQDDIVLVLVYPANEIACYADVQRAVGFAGEDVDHGLRHSPSNALTRSCVDSEKTGSPLSRG